jgi:hypothetical protein
MTVGCLKHPINSPAYSPFTNSTIQRFNSSTVHRFNLSFVKEQPPVYHIIGETIVRHYRCFEVTGDE